MGMVKADKYLLYRRIYRMKNKNFNPSEIATVLKIPLSTVNSVLDRLNNDTEVGKKKVIEKTIEYFFVLITKRDYTVVDIGGPITEKIYSDLTTELDNVVKINDSFPAVIKLSDATEIEEGAVKIFLDFIKKMRMRKRLVYVLDPSDDVDDVLVSSGLYDEVDVFGTESALTNEIKKNVAVETKKRPGAINF